METVYDCAIIGDGPAGLSAAVTLRQRGLTPLVFGMGKSLLQKAERIDNYLGMPAMTGEEMYKAFLAHAAQSGVEMRHAKVTNIMPFDGTFMLNAEGEIFTARSVLLAMGAAKAPAVPGEAEFLGRGVSYCATCDGMLYRGKNVAVYAQSEDAVKEAEFLQGIGCAVTLVTPKALPQPPQGMATVTGRLEEVSGENTVTGITVSGTKILVQGVFILRDAIAPNALLGDALQVQNGVITKNEKCETNIPGVFAAGDVAGKPLQVSKATGEGLTAALAIAELLSE